MDEVRIERADSIPLLLTWMEQMQLAATIDQCWQPHREWEGFSYGQLTVLFIAFVLQQRNHRLSAFEDWLHQHHHLIQATTGWEIGPKAGTDDRLGILLQTLGADADRLHPFHHQHGQHLVHPRHDCPRGWQLPDGAAAAGGVCRAASAGATGGEPGADLPGGKVVASATA